MKDAFIFAAKGCPDDEGNGLYLYEAVDTIPEAALADLEMRDGVNGQHAPSFGSFELTVIEE